MLSNSINRNNGNTIRRKSSGSSSSNTLQILLYSALGACLLILTFLAGQRHCMQRHASSSFENNSGNAVSTSLNNFKHSSKNNENNNAAAELFIPRLRNNNKNNTDKQKPQTNEEKWGKPIQRPSDWSSWTFYDIHHGFQCGRHANDMNKPLPDMEYWNYMRKIYKEVVDSDAVFDDVVLPTEGYAMDNQEGRQPYYAKISPGKGRGLFASRDIQKGEVVHDGTKSDTEISPADFRRFLFALPQKMACDSTEWTWTQQLTKNGPFTIRTAFNISILMNASTNPNAMPRDEYSSKFYALRDIKKGEEILTDYKIYPTRYDLLGM